MSNAAAEPIQVGAMTVLFHVDAEQSDGSVTVFECVAPAKARMPAPHSHDATTRRARSARPLRLHRLAHRHSRPPPLTMVSVPAREIGIRAMRTLANLIEGKKP